MKREFILAISIFAGMAVVGTIFGLWFVASYAPPPHTPSVAAPAAPVAPPGSPAFPSDAPAAPPASPPVPVTPR